LAIVIAGITAAVAIYNKIKNAGAEANQKMNDAVSTYKQDTTELESLNGQLETTKQSITELQNKGGLTILEKGQLEDLRQINKELEIQKDILGKTSLKDAKEAASKVTKAVKANYTNMPTSQEEIDKQRNKYYVDQEYDEDGNATGDGGYWKYTSDKNISVKLAKINLLKESQKKLSADSAEFKSNETSIENLSDSVWNAVSAWEDYKSTLESLPKEALSTNDLATLQTLTDSIETVYKQLDPAKWGQMKLDDFFSLDSIQDEKRNLLDLAKDKKYEGISKGDFSDYFKTVASDLQEALGENYLDIIADAINSEAGVVNVDNIKKNLKKDYAQSKFIGNERGFSSWVDNLSNEDTEIVYKLSLNADSANWSLDQWIQKLQEYKQSSEQFLNDLESNVSKTQSVIEKVGKANTLLGKSNNGNSVELDADQLKEYADALEYVNGAFQLNYEKVKQLNQEKVDEQINANVEAMKKAQEQLLINNQQISNMQSELSGLNAAQSQRKQDLEDSISKLQDENSGIETTIKEYQYLCVALGEASSAYQRWLDMQNGPSAGDFSSQTTTAFKQIQQVVKSKNGWGTSDFLYIRLYNTN